MTKSHFSNRIPKDNNNITKSYPTIFQDKLHLLKHKINKIEIKMDIEKVIKTNNFGGLYDLWFITSSKLQTILGNCIIILTMYGKYILKDQTNLFCIGF